MHFIFPKTRYQGSKRKLVRWLIPIFKDLKGQTVLDAFGGTGVISYLFKLLKKQVTYNDILTANWYCGKALIENNSVKFNLSNSKDLFIPQNDFVYKSIIKDNFQDIYYTHEEDYVLDIVVQNIHQIEYEFEKALAFFALFQACIQKRPFNLFHRKNLNLRLGNVNRSFGNLKTWNTPFNELFNRAIKEANRAIFNNEYLHKALNLSVFDIIIPPEGYDLVYLDPPYISEKGISVDYRDFYHFLEGLCYYDKWGYMIDKKSKHKRLNLISNEWNNPKKNFKAFDKVIKKFQDSILLISYRSPGLPSINDLKDLLYNYKKSITIMETDYKYSLTKKAKRTKEVIILAKN